MNYIKRKQLVHQIRSKQIQSYSYFWYNKLISLACWILCGHGKSVECVSGYYLTLFQTHRNWKASICTSDPFPNQFSSIWHKLLQLLYVFKLLTQLSQFSGIRFYNWIRNLTQQRHSVLQVTKFIQHEARHLTKYFKASQGVSSYSSK